MELVAFLCVMIAFTMGYGLSKALRPVQATFKFARVKKPIVITYQDRLTRYESFITFENEAAAARWLSIRRHNVCDPKVMVLMEI